MGPSTGAFAGMRNVPIRNSWTLSSGTTPPTFGDAGASATGVGAESAAPVVELDEELVASPDLSLGELADVADVRLEEPVGSPGPRVHATIVVTPKKTATARDLGRPTGATSTASLFAPQKGQRRSLTRT